MMTARFGFSVERAHLIFVESPRNSGFHFSKTSSASSFDTNFQNDPILKKTWQILDGSLGRTREFPVFWLQSFWLPVSAVLHT